MTNERTRYSELNQAVNADGRPLEIIGALSSMTTYRLRESLSGERVLTMDEMMGLSKTLNLPLDILFPEIKAFLSSEQQQGVNA